MTKHKLAVEGAIDTTRVKGLLFDVDGTLSDTDDHLVDRLSRFFQPISWLFPERNPQTFARWLVMASETPANLAYSLTDRLGVDEPLSKVYSWLSRHSRSHKSKRDRFWIIPGVKEMLQSLSTEFPLAVVSARDERTTLYFLEYFDLLHFFEVVVTAQTCKHTKPFPDPVIHAAEQLGLNPEACLMIGDTIVDVRAGNAAGAQTAAVLCGFGTQQELIRTGADIILNTTSDLQDLLKKGKKS